MKKTGINKVLARLDYNIKQATVTDKTGFRQVLLIRDYTK